MRYIYIFNLDVGKDFLSFPAGSVLKKLPANARDIGLTLGGEDPLEKEMTTHSIFLPRKSYQRRSMMGYSPWDHKSVEHNLATKQKQQGFLRPQKHQYFFKICKFNFVKVKKLAVSKRIRQKKKAQTCKKYLQEIYTVYARHSIIKAQFKKPNKKRKRFHQTEI